MPLFIIIFPLVIIGKFISFISRFFRIGYGGTWPGEVVLWIKPDILRDFFLLLKQGCIFVTGTNGKSTTSLMIRKILEKKGEKVVHNASGANLLNGIISSFIEFARWNGQIDADWGVFEVDENILPVLISYYSDKELFNKKKLIIVLLNLFRDQLDRYGEVDLIVEKWIKALKKLPREAEVILNADDPQIVSLAQSLNLSLVRYFGIENPSLFIKIFEHATDSIFCPQCGSRLNFSGVYFSHLGIWQCLKCGLKRPKPKEISYPSPLPGIYNQYNTLAAVSVAKSLDIPEKIINQAFDDFSPAFGRQEEFEIRGKKVKIFLSKNPAGFNATLRTVLSLGGKTILLVLNDRLPDGQDVSWIWDVDFELIPNNVYIVVSGDRAYEMGLRIKYARRFENSKFKIIERLDEAISYGINKIPNNEILYILPNYSAMLEVRKILKGRKIL